MPDPNATPKTAKRPRRNQYTIEECLKAEKVIGRNFLTPGGEEEVFHMLCSGGSMQPKRILDVGSGFGGPSFVMAREYKARVDGIDINGPLINVAKKRLEQENKEIAENVHFSCGGIFSLPLEEAEYDLIFGNGVFLHFKQKTRLLKQFHRLLKKEGMLIFGDYCLGDDEIDEEMTGYINEHKYHILRMEDWDQRLRSSGFQRIDAEDCTSRFRNYTEKALRNKKLLPEGWQERLEERVHRIERGQHLWWVFCYRRT